MVSVSPAYAAKSEDNISTAQGCGPQIVSAFVKQRLITTCSLYFRSSQALKTYRRTFWKDQRTPARVAWRNYHANHAIFLRVMVHLKCLRCTYSRPPCST